MKILHILYRATIGGSERVVYNLINEQLKSNYRVTCILLADGGGFQQKFRDLLNGSLRVFNIDKFQHVIKLYRFLKKMGPEWIIHNHVRNIKLGLLLKPLRNPKILTEHMLTDKLKQIDPKNYKKLKLYYRLYENDYQYVTSVSRAVKDTLLTDFAIDPAKIKVIFNGLQLSAIKKNRSNGYFKIGNATHFEKIKNLDLFLAIAEEIVHRDESIQFLLIGDGTQKSSIVSFIRERNLTQNIFVLDQQEDLTLFFNQLNLGLITSYSETFSMFAAECLIRGIPVVASANGGLKEVVSDEKNGYLIDSLQTEDFIEKILKLKNERSTYQQFCDHALHSAEKFTIENTYQQYHQLYSELAEGNEPIKNE